jgi:hypothetical protein
MEQNLYKYYKYYKKNNQIGGYDNFKDYLLGHTNEILRQNVIEKINFL